MLHHADLFALALCALLPRPPPCVLKPPAAAYAEAASPCGGCRFAATTDPALCAAASTGLAASALGGTTLNAFAGVGRAEGSADQLARMASRPSALQRWRRAKTLIVDEVSPRQQQLCYCMLQACALNCSCKEKTSARSRSGHLKAPA